MWTHLTPYLEQEQTGASIARNSRIALYRALNLRRLIAMTGSGATVPFGLPDWADLALLFVDATQTQIDKCLEGHDNLYAASEIRRRIAPLIRQIRSLCGLHDTDDPARIAINRAQLRELGDMTMVMDLCETLLKLLPDDESRGRTRLWLARHEFAQSFRQPEHVLVRRRLGALLGGDAHGEMFRYEKLDELRNCFPEMQKAAQDDPEVSKRLDALNELLSPERPENPLFDYEHDGSEQDQVGLFARCLAFIIKGSKAADVVSQVASWPMARPDEVDKARERLGPLLPRRGEKDVVGRDIVRAVFGDLGATRIATLNYDVQVEREILRKMEEEQSPDAVGFWDLCKDYRTERKHEKRLVVESGIRKGAVSITLSPGNVGEIVNFAAFSRRYERQVLHLHGRFDDPQNMVVTQPDYLRVYMRDSTPREIFREAQEILFGGNDVILLGIGMKEEDVLRPFRRFVAREGDRESSQRRIFLLRQTHHKKGRWQAENDLFALRQFVNYNVSTIFLGGPRFRAVQRAFECLTTLLPRALKSVGSGEDVYSAADDEQKLKALKEAYAIFRASCLPPAERKTDVGPVRGAGVYENALRAKSWRDGTLQTFLLSEDELELLRGLPEHLPTSPDQLRALDALLHELQGRTVSRALCREMADLRRESGDWWDQWRHPPYERRALYHMDEGGLSGASEGYLWVRHCPAAIDQRHGAASGHAWRPLVEAFQVARTLARPAAELRGHQRVLRLTAPRGAGKGSLVRLLMHQKNHGRLFAQHCRDFDKVDWDRATPQNYSGAFVAHLSFSMEFSSVALALTRFMARHVAELQLRPYDRTWPTDGDAREDAVLAGLRATLKQIEAVDRWRDKADRPDSRNRERIERTGLAQQFAAKERLCAERSANGGLNLIEALATGGRLTADEQRQLAQWLYVSRREAEPRLLQHPAFADESQLEPLVERPHRLDVLREAMNMYRDRAEGTDDRLFICLSGLDRICDEDGDGRNPMHRALFRLLMDPSSPIDRTEVSGTQSPERHENTGRTDGQRDIDGNVARTAAAHVTFSPGPPLDYVLIAGKPDAPICFLSNEASRPGRISTHLEKLFSRRSKTRRVLHRWSALEKFSWEERAHLTPLYGVLERAVPEGKRSRIAIEDWHEFARGESGKEDPGHSRERMIAWRVYQFVKWAIETDSGARPRRIAERHSTRRLHRALWENVFLTSLVLTCWAEVKQKDGAFVGAVGGTVLSFVEELDRVIARDGPQGVVRSVLERHLSSDREAPETKPVGHLERYQAKAMAPDADLTDLILRHLALFSLPVEPRVLLDCPLIRHRLRGLYNPLDMPEFIEEAMRPGEAEPSEGKRRKTSLENAIATTQDWCERVWMLRKLRAQLDRLCRRGLVIPVLASHDPLHLRMPAQGARGEMPGWSDVAPPVFDGMAPTAARDSEAASDESAFLHRRFALHARLRELLSHRMELQVADEGDLNHHQISIYSDQPRDLPTPSHEHFQMMRDLLDGQISRCRQTLASVYRQSHAGRVHQRRSWDDEEDRLDPAEGEELRQSLAADMMTRDAALRLFGPGDELANMLGKHSAKKARKKHGLQDTKELERMEVDRARRVLDPDGIGGAMGRIHAVPQRLRACFSLVRGAFSVGALSRLDTMSKTVEGEPPFELYRGWLRGLLNAATGLERNRREIDWALGGVFFHLNVDEMPAASTGAMARNRDLIARKARGDDTTVDEDFERISRCWSELGFCIPRLEADEPSKAASKDRLEEEVRDDYYRRLMHVDVAARRVEEVLREASELGFTHRQHTTHKKIRHPFYRDEIAWLYNERALASLIQGRIFDALPLFRQAQFIMSHRKTPQSDTKAFHAAERRVQLNLAIANIDRGNIALARSLLEDLEYSSRHIRRSTPSRLINYARGYTALCDHLGGSLERAIRGYRQVLDTFVANRELRAVSIFNRHLGDLYARTGELTLADNHLQHAVNAASQAEQRDVQYLAIASQASVLIDRDQLDKARGFTERVSRYARQMGLYRLEADALLVDAKLKTRRGENGAAAEAAANAVSICLKNGLRLRKVSSLVKYGAVQFARGESQLGRGVLEEAKREAEKLGYQIQAARAADILATV